MEPGPPLDGDTLLRHADGVRRLARSLVRDEHRAEDVAQETFARTLERPPRTGWPLRAWLAGVARHVALTSARGERRRADRERAAARPEAVPSAAEAVSRVAEQRRVLDAVLGLDEPHRTVVVLRFFEGLPPRAIALRLGVPVETVYTRLKRALSNLRRRLDSEHGGDSRRCSFALLAVARGGPATWLVVPGLGAIVVKKAVVLAVLLLGLGLVGWRIVASTERSQGVDLGARAPSQIEGNGSAHLAAAPRTAPGESAALLGPTIDFATVDRDLDLHGTVVKEDGSPVAGAELSCLSYPARRSNLYFTGQWFQSVAGPFTRSASDGTFRIRLRRGERVDLRVSAAGVTTQERPDCLAGERVRIVVRPAAALLVLVRDRDGAPVARTRLRLVRLRYTDTTFVRTAETGADGRARFDDLPGSTQASLEVTPTALGSPRPMEVRVPRAAEALVEVTLPVGRTITGRVTDAATHAPLSGAIVGMGWQQDRAVSTDADGRYVLIGWTGEDETEVHALADGYGREGFVLGAASTHDFVLEAGDSVAGRVVDADGAAVPRAFVAAAVSAYGSGVPRRDSYRWGTAGADGRFRLDGLRRDLSHTLIVLATGYGRTLLDFDPKPESAGLIDLGEVVLPPPRRIEGRVLDSAGSGVPRVSVTLRGANADRSRLRPAQPPLESGYGARDIAFTDDLGRFRFADLAAGDYTVTARPGGEPEAKAEVVVPPQKDALGVEIRLAEGRRIRVTVVDAAGGPVPGVFVMGASRGFQLQAMTGPDGVATFLAAGTSLSVSVAQPRTAGTRYIIPKQTEVLAGAFEARIVLVEGAVVAGRVLDPAGAPLGGAYIDARKEGGTVGGAWADAQGQFEVVVPAAGAVDLSLSGRLSRLGGAGVVPTPLFGSAAGIAPGTTDVVIRATLPSTDRRMRLVVLDPEGAPAKGVRLMVGPEWSGTAAGSSVTSEDGTFELENLPARPLTMTVGAMPDSKGWNRWLWQPVGPVVPEGQTVTVRLVQGVLIVGVVLRPDGTPAAGAIVRSFRDGDARHMTNADADGRFSLLVHRTTDLPLGLRAQDPLDLMAEAAQEGVGEGTGDVTLRLVRVR